MKKKHALTQKIIAITAVVAMGLSVVPAANSDAAAKVKLNKKSINLNVGGKFTLKVSGKNIKRVSFKSTKKKFVAVKKKGSKKAVITAKKAGKAVVKVTVKLKKGKKVLSCAVKVSNKADNKQNVTVPKQTPVSAATSLTPNSTVAPTTNTTQTQVPSPTTDPSVPTAVPVLDENNLAVVDYPTIFSDIPDCDFIRVGCNYYMVSTTMNLCPGVPIMKSTDLAHWEIVNYVYDALPDLEQNNLENGKQMYSNGSWAAAIRYNEETGLFYVVFNVNGGGFFCYTTNDIENGTWQGYHIDASFHDPALLFDDGHMYVIYGGSNLQELDFEEPFNEGELGELVKVGNSKKLFDKPSEWGLWEGSHAYHIGKYYYIMIIASPASGWFRTEVCYRTDDLLNGEWEEQIVYQGSTYEYTTGLAQGGIVDTIYGDWYGILFQDHGAVGRIPSIVAVNWDYTDKDGNNYKDWPIMGTYDDNGEFHASEAKQSMKVRLNNSGKSNYIVDDDDFTYAEGDKLKLVWQWNHNPDNNNWSVTANPGYYRITNGALANNIWFARNSLTQRTVGPKFTSETAIVTDGMKAGDYAGIVAVGGDYGMIGVKCDENGNRYIFQGSGTDGGKKAKASDVIKENAVSSEQIKDGEKVFLKVEYSFNTGKQESDKATFYYSMDGSNWTKFGEELSMRFDIETTFMGARTWLSSYATSEEGGYVDFDYYKQYQ